MKNNNLNIKKNIIGYSSKDVEKLIAINNFENAQHFYRKHTLFTLLSGNPISIGDKEITITLIILVVKTFSESITPESTDPITITYESGNNDIISDSYTYSDSFFISSNIL